MLTVHIGCSCCFPVNKVDVSSLQALRSSMVGTAGRGLDLELVQGEPQAASVSPGASAAEEEDRNKGGPVKTH